MVFDYGADRDGKTPFTPPSQYEELRDKCPVSRRGRVGLPTYLPTCLPSANFDPEYFEDPETLNVRRKTLGHVAFGYGSHRCLGQHIVRVAEVAFETLLRRIPNLRLAVDLDQVRFRLSTSSFGVYELPVTW